MNLSPEVVRQALTEITERWSLLIICATFTGLHRYDEYQRELGIATNILADRLRLLTERDILARKPYRAGMTRHEYHLTERGLALYPVILAIANWVEAWGNPPPAPTRTLLLRHKPCNQPLVAQMVCASCGQVIVARDVMIDPP